MVFLVPDKVYAINSGEDEKEVTLESLVANEEDAWWNKVPLNNLDLSSNQLTQLSPKIANLCSLTTLTVSAFFFYFIKTFILNLILKLYFLICFAALR